MSLWATFNNCCCCQKGSVVPRLENLTRVRPAGDTTPAGATVTPFSRLDAAQYFIDAGNALPHTCTSDHPAGAGSDASGYCGTWLTSPGDASALSMQEVKAQMDDIIACAVADTTHYNFDHNCYLKNGTSGTDVVNMVMPKLFGGQWVFAEHFWSGTFGLMDAPNLTNPAFPAPQVKYLQVDAQETYANLFHEKHYPAGTSPTPTTPPTFDLAIQTNNSTGQITRVVNQVNRLITQGGTAPTETQVYYPSGPVTTIKACADGPQVNADLSAFPVPGTDIPTIAGLVGNNGSGWLASIAAVNSDGSGWQAIGTVVPFATGNPTTDTIYANVVVKRTNTSYTWNLDLVIFFESAPGGGSGGDDVWEWRHITSTGSIELSVPYTSDDAYADFKQLLASFDMGNFKLASLRGVNGDGSADEKLWHGPLIIYNGVRAAVSPIGLGCPINNYAAPVADANGHAAWTYDPLLYAPTTGTPLPANYATWTPVSGQGADWVPTWGQLPWLDPNSYIWQTQALPAHGVYFNTGALPELIPANFTSATLLTGMWDGSIIATNSCLDSSTQRLAGGSDRHFWFGAPNYRRDAVHDPTSGALLGYQWNLISTGAFSAAPRPSCTVRWMPPYEEQYDGAALGTPPIGNFPQSWMDYSGGKIKGGKFCMAVNPWQAVNYGFPCGPGKYAIEQTSVCCITAGTGAGGSLTIAPTTGATAPSSGYIVIEGGGVYPVTGLSGSTLTVDAKIDGLPTGYVFRDPALYSDGATHLGRLRWIGYTQNGVTFGSAPGICGRVAITTAYASGTLTVLPATAQPYLRVDPATAAIRAVNLYDAGMTLLTVTPLVLARTDDLHFTVAAANYPTAVWMVDAAVDWTKYSAVSQHTGVHLDWSFDKRQAALATSAQPNWLGGTGAGTGTGTVGCLSQSVTQFNYTYKAGCPAIVGIVPYYSQIPSGGDTPVGSDTPSPNVPADNFDNAVLFDFPPRFLLDDQYGSHWQGALMLSMPAPEWEAPFFPSCNGFLTNWAEDVDGTGWADGTGPISGIDYTKWAWFPGAYLVEAATTVPAGCALPAALKLFYDPSNIFPPPYYPNGIPYGSDVLMDWGFITRACNSSNHFYTEYMKFVTCP